MLSAGGHLLGQAKEIRFLYQSSLMLKEYAMTSFHVLSYFYTYNENNLMKIILKNTIFDKTTSILSSLIKTVTFSIIVRQQLGYFIGTELIYI